MLKLRCNLGIIQLELYRSASKKVSKRAEMPFMKLNGKSQLDLLRLLMSHREVTHREISDYFFRRRELSCLITKMQFYAS